MPGVRFPNTPSHSTRVARVHSHGETFSQSGIHQGRNSRPGEYRIVRTHHTAKKDSSGEITGSKERNRMAY